MRMLIVVFLMFTQNIFAEEINLSPQKCKMEIVKKAYYLNLCPSGWIMVGASPLPGNNSTLQILCAQVEVICE